MESEEKLGWSLSPAGHVVITMTPGDYDSLLIRLGYSSASKTFSLAHSLALLNRLNAGNPNYRPYAIPAEAK
jgi:hypothetical protein